MEATAAELAGEGDEVVSLELWAKTVEAAKERARAKAPRPQIIVCQSDGVN